MPTLLSPCTQQAAMELSLYDFNVPQTSLHTLYKQFDIALSLYRIAMCLCVYSV